MAETTQTFRSAGVTRSKKKTSQLKEIWRRYRKNKAAVLGLVILVFILGIALFADLIIPYSKCIEQVGADRLQGPSLAHFSEPMNMAATCLPESCTDPDFPCLSE